MTVTAIEDLNRLADETNDHLAREIKLMAKISRQAQVVRRHLLDRNIGALQTETRRLQPLQHDAHRLGTYRAHLMQAISIRLKIPADQVTVKQLARQLHGEKSDRLLQQRAELARLARHVHRLNHSNLTIASCFTHFANLLGEALTGRPTVTRYSRQGQLASNSTPSFFETDV